MKFLRNINNSFRNDRKNLGEYHPWVGIQETLTNSLQSFLEMIVRSLVNINPWFNIHENLTSFLQSIFQNDLCNHLRMIYKKFNECHPFVGYSENLLRSLFKNYFKKIWEYQPWVGIQKPSKW